MLAHIDHGRRNIGGNMWLSYDSDCEELVVRILPKFRHVAAQLIFSNEITTKARSTGLSIGSLMPSGATRYHRHSGSSSEGVRVTHKPSAVLASIPDWPTIVVESGFLEPLTRLRVDAAWWLTESGGKSIAISIQKPQGIIVIEKWGLGPANHPRPPTRAVPNSTVLLAPTKLHQITIIRQANPSHQSKVTGAPMVLEFAQILPRCEIQTYRMGSRELKTDRRE